MKRLITVLFISLLMTVFSVSAVSAEELGKQEIISQHEEFVPQFTTNPDSSLKNNSHLFDLDSKGYALFYTQTTALALVAGYLILFKIKGIPKHEKMHRRK